MIDINDPKQEVGFEHNGIDCRIVERPDLLYSRSVCGFRGEDVWLPNIDGHQLCFDQSLTDEQIKDACVSIMDKGSFKGSIEPFMSDYIVVTDIISD